MEVFRISRDKYTQQLTSSGTANRWNFNNQYVLYTGSSRSLSTLELVVHRSAIEPTFTYKVLSVHRL
ncbi:MAG: RES domain-containing protein [Bacteroidetes bacterium]|nr:RES domain-containing protein [Bacteroidota bacterium]